METISVKGQPRFALLSSAAQLVSILLLGLYLTNLAYGFSGSGTHLGDFQFVSHMLGGKEPGKGGNRFADSTLKGIPVPFPAQYVLGFDAQRKDFEDFGRPSYLRGEWKHGGWWYYYIYGLAVKTPHGSQLLVLLALLTVVFARRLRLRAIGSLDFVVLFTPAAVLFVLVSAQLEFNQHVRYVLPVLGFAYVFAGASASWAHGRFGSKRRPAALVCGSGLFFASVLATISSTLNVYPHQLAYFNELAGGPESGYRHLLHSNLDWGQDLLDLRRLSIPAEATVYVSGWKSMTIHADGAVLTPLTSIRRAYEAPIATDENAILVLSVQRLMDPELENVRARILRSAERIGFTLFVVYGCPRFASGDLATMTDS